VTEAVDWNTQVINEFRANGGRAGGPFEGADLLLLHSIGARSGQERINPLTYLKVNGSYAIFASKGGAPTHPDWYHNIVAHPETTIEVGTETLPVTARVAQGQERERIWEEQTRSSPQFAQYEKSTNRTIPVVILEPRQA
jgi:deazaflavin-dependent oxidoreductase (nitroreductase family)